MPVLRDLMMQRPYTASNYLLPPAPSKAIPAVSPSVKGVRPPATGTRTAATAPTKSSVAGVVGCIVKEDKHYHQHLSNAVEEGLLDAAGGGGRGDVQLCPTSGHQRHHHHIDDVDVDVNVDGGELEEGEAPPTLTLVGVAVCRRGRARGELEVDTCRLGTRLSVFLPIPPLLLLICGSSIAAPLSEHVTDPSHVLIHPNRPNQPSRTTSSSTRTELWPMRRRSVEWQVMLLELHPFQLEDTPMTTSSTKKTGRRSSTSREAEKLVASRETQGRTTTTDTARAMQMLRDSEQQSSSRIR